MFRLLSKETNIFSIPIYIGILLFIIFISSSLSLDFLNIISSIIAFMGLGLGYLLFNRIALTYHSHLPLFLYSIFIGSVYPKSIDIGISMALFTNSILLFFLTNDSYKFREDSYLLIGNILAINFIFLPATWPLSIFLLIHIIATSDNILQNIFRFIIGIFLIFIGYGCLMYFLDYQYFDENYIPFISSQLNTNFSGIYFIAPSITFCFLAIIDHFIHFNKKSPRSKFKYTFILSYLFVQSLIIFFYMGNSYEYLLLIIFPISIILSRFFKFLNRPWLQEISIWVITISCLFSPKLYSLFNTIIKL